jgi:hypothetical protein
MRYPILNAPAQLMAWAARLCQQLERDVPERPPNTDFTLTANAASSTMSHNAIRPTSSFSVVPLTANGAAEIGGGTLYHSTPTLGQVVWNHANNAQNDRTFRITIHNP